MSLIRMSRAEGVGVGRGGVGVNLPVSQSSHENALKGVHALSLPTEESSNASSTRLEIS